MIGPRSTVLRKDGHHASWPSTRPSPTSTTAWSAAAATPGSSSSSWSRPTSGSSCCTTTCCRSPAPAASATSCTTPATRWRCCSAPACTWCCPATSTCPTRGGSRTCSSSTPAPSRRCACAGTRGPVTTWSRSGRDEVDIYRRYPFHGRERIIRFSPETLAYEKHLPHAAGATVIDRAAGAGRRRALPAGRARGPAPGAGERRRGGGGAAARRIREAGRADPDYGVPLERRRRRHGRRTPWSRPPPRTARPRCSTSPTSRCWTSATGSRWPAGRSPPASPTAGADFALRPAAPRARRRARRWPSSARASGSARRPCRGHVARGCWTPADRTWWSSRWAAAARRSPSWSTRAERPVGVADLLARARAGQHAASDFLEDAALAGVTTVGRAAAAAAACWARRTCQRGRGRAASPRRGART